jgi:hypothetical protein
MNTQSMSKPGSNWWNYLVMAVSLAALGLLVSLRHPRTDQLVLYHWHVNRLFLGCALLTVVLALNAVGYLVIRRRPFTGIVLSVMTGITVFFLVEWSLRMGR